MPSSSGNRSNKCHQVLLTGAIRNLVQLTGLQSLQPPAGEPTPRPRLLDGTNNVAFFIDSYVKTLSSMLVMT